MRRSSRTGSSSSGSRGRRPMRWLFLLVALFAFLPATSSAESADSEATRLSLPDDLKPYANIEEVFDKVAKVIEILGTAEFNVASHSDSLEEPPCGPINRGMMLSHAGYNMIINYVERGIISPAAVLPKSGYSGVSKGLVSPRRGLLLRVWDLSKLHKLLEVRQKLEAWPEPLKHYVKAFLSELLRFRKTRREMMLRNEYTAQTQRRSSRIYYYRYHYERHWRKIKSNTYKEKIFHERFPKPLIYDKHAEKLYQIFESIPKPERPENRWTPPKTLVESGVG